MTRSNSAWLTIRAGLENLVLQENLSSYHIFHVYDVDTQAPQLITMIGHTVKAWVLQKLRFNSSPGVAAKGAIHLRRDTDTIDHTSPILIADCELHTIESYSKLGIQKTAGNLAQQTLTWHKDSPGGTPIIDLAFMLYAKLLSPFSTIIYIFADDFGGLSTVAQILAVWLSSWGDSSDLPQTTRPHVVILIQQDDFEVFEEEQQSRTFTYNVAREAKQRHMSLISNGGSSNKMPAFEDSLVKHFSELRVMAFPSRRNSRQWSQIKARIYQDSNERHRSRQQANVAFSVRHLKAFLSLAIVHFSLDVTSPFSFIKAARRAYPVPAEYTIHLKHFLAHVDKTQILNFATHIIAGTFVFDCFPTGMHFFEPGTLFRSFYHKLCLAIDPFESGKTDSYTQFVNTIEVAFTSGLLELHRTQKSDIALYQANLSRFSGLWKKIYSSQTCFSCLARRPDNKLQCGHTLCSSCTMAHGESHESEPWIFNIASCPFCKHANTTKFSEKPATAGVRALIAEGGGIRGIIPLSFLRELELAINLPMGIQDHVDIAFGSSSGALVILGLFSNNWNTQRCLNEFLSFSQLAFRKRPIFRLPFITSSFVRQVLETIVSFATDSRYSSNGIDKALKSAFGEGTAMFDAANGSTKLGVVATSVKNSATYVFTNYNSRTDETSERGYKLGKQDHVGRNLLLWQVARASTAAPPYFKPYRGFQDGGLGGHNNPINLALWEQDVLWSRDKKQPDIVISLGTGFKRDSNDHEAQQLLERPSFFSTRYVPRLFRSFLNFFVGETRWLELQNTLLPQVKERYHRMNIEFHNKEPDLDDIRSISSLQRFAETQARSGETLQHCADNLIASLFYLELDKLPVFDRNLFVCEGRILCRIGPSHQALVAIIGRLKKTKSRFYLSFQQSIPCTDAILCRKMGEGAAYSQPIRFYVSTLDDSIDIKIDGIITRARSISNCPYNIRTLIKDQNLDCEFGHRKGRRRPMVDGDREVKRMRVR